MNETITPPPASMSPIMNEKSLLAEDAQIETFAQQEEDDETRRLSGLKTIFDPATLVRKGTRHTS